MKKITKILSLFFVAAVAFTLAACGAKTEAPKTNAPVQTTTKAPVVTTKAPVVTTKAPEVTTKAPEVTTAAPHTVHDYSGEYKYDEDGHWKECTVCGNKSEVEDHEFTVQEVRPTLETEGTKTYTCDVCGYTYTENTGLAKVWEVGDDSYLLDYASLQTDSHFTTFEYSEDGKTAHLAVGADYGWNALIAYASGKTEGYVMEVTVTTPATATKAANFALKPNNVDDLAQYCSAPIGETKVYKYSGDQLPTDMEKLVIMFASAEMEGYISIRWFEMKPELVSPDLYILGNGYYNSTDSTRYNQFIEGDATATKFIGTRFFTKDMLPVGTILEIAEGYQYRPEGWVDDNKQTSRQPNVTTARVVIDDAWWGDYVKRAFNIAKTNGAAINTPEEYAAAVAAFKIYVPYGTVIKPMELKDVDLMASDPLTTNYHEFSKYLVVAKNSGSSFEWVNLDVTNDMTGYTKIVINVQGTAGEKILFKPNNKNTAETTYTMDGTMQEFTLELPEGFVWDAGKEMIIMPNPNAQGTKNSFLITKLEAQGEGKDPINLLMGALAKDSNCSAYQPFVFAKPTTVGAWDSIQIKVDKNLAGYPLVKYTVQGTAGEQVMLKVNDVKEVRVDLDGTIQTGYIDISDMTFDPNKLTMVIFANPGVNGTGNSIVLYELAYLGKLPAKTVTPSSTAKDGPITFSDDKMTATISDTTLNGKWGRWDYTLQGCDSYNKVTVVLRGTAGLAFHAKLDTAGTCPLGNNYFDSMTGNKTNAKFGEDGLVTLTWDLSIFEAKCTKESKTFNVDYLSKLVFFLGQFGTEAQTSDVSSGTIELVSITLE